MRTLILTLTILAAGTPTGAIANEPPGEEQLTSWVDEQMEGSFADELAYTRRTVTADSSRVERFDPRREPGEQWRLLQEDGEEPNADRLAEYRENHRESAAEDDGDEEEENDDRLVDPSTLMLADETESHWVYSFQPLIGGFEDQVDRIEGQLYVPRGGSFIERIEVHNTDTIEPAFAVDIHSFTLTLEFDQLDDGRTVIRRSESDVSGRAYAVKSFEETQVQEWSDYEVVGGEGDSTEAAQTDAE